MDAVTPKKIIPFPAGDSITIPKAKDRPGFFSRVKTEVLLISMMAFAVVISLTALLRQSLRLDESQSLWQSSRTPSGVLNIIAQDVHVPLYGMMLHFWQLFFGNSVSSTRLLSLIFFVLGVPAIYLLGKTAYNKSIGLFAALLYTVSPFLNWYGNETRMYSMLAFVTIVNQYFFLKMFKDGQATRGHYGKIWLGYFATALVGIYTHYFFWFVLLTQGIFFLFYRKLFPPKTFRYLALAAVTLALALSPWLYYVRKINEINNAAPIIIKPTLINLFNTLSQFMFGFQDDHLNTLIISLWPLSVLFVFLSLNKKQKISPETVYLFLTTLLPIILAFIVSVTYRPLFITRYLIFTIPSLFLFLAWFLTVYPKQISLSVKTIVILSMLATLAVQIKASDTPVKENYEQASQYLESKATAQDIIVVSAPFTVYPVEYYYKGPAEIATLPLWNRFVYGPIPVFSAQKLPGEIDQIKSDHQRIFLLLSYDQGYESQIKSYFDTHFQRLEEKNFSPKMDLYVYQLRYDQVTFNQILDSIINNKGLSSKLQ